MNSSSRTGNHPDITLKTSKQEISVMPDSRQDISLQVRNHGDRELTIELSALGVPESWLTFSPQIAYLKPGEEDEVQLRLRPTAGTEMGIYTISVIATAQEDPEHRAEAEISVRVAAFHNLGRIGVMMEETQFSVTPGSRTGFAILLHNRGLKTDTFRLGIEGIPVNWISTETPQVQLEPGEKATINISIHPPQSPNSRAGRHRFQIQVTSQLTPDETADVECTLAVLGYSRAAAKLEPEAIQANTPARLHVENLGNFDDAYDVSWISGAGDLVFEAFDQTGKAALLGTGRASTRLRVPAGQVGSLAFRARPVSRPILGGESAHPYTITIQPADRHESERLELNGRVTSTGLLPVWVLGIALVFLVSLVCLAAFVFNWDRFRTPATTQTAAAGTEIALGATQTIIANQTAAAVAGGQDTDGDGLIDSAETDLGTDPNNPDTDGDELLDGDEINLYGTNPLNLDSDGDGLSDGDEVLRRGTDPLNPDTDADGLLDGDEAQRTTDPLNPDTDRDGSRDGDEITLGTDPLNPDSDADQLLDGQESPPCPNPLDPDSDDDGTIDSADLDPCDAANPALTATAAAGAITDTPLPSETSTGIPTTPTATEVPPQGTPAPAPFSGLLAFESNREGNPEIYIQNGSNGTITRLTNSVGLDTQPAWSPNGAQLAFTSNRDGDNEIYLINADGSNPINLTKDPGDDQFPSWSPDGVWVAFSSNRSGNWEIYASRVDGSELVVLTNDPNDDWHPIWLGNDQIIFASNREGNFEIYSMNTSGSNLINLTNNPANEYFPAYSPPTNLLAFNSDRDGNWEVYTVPINGGTQTNVSNYPADDLHPRWSPDGAWIAFDANRDGNLEIYAVRNDASEIINMTANAANDLHPAWR